MKLNKILITGILLCFASICVAQKSAYERSARKYKNKYIDQINDDEEIKKYWYNYVATISQSNEYRVRLFHPDTKQKLAEYLYETEDYKIKNGPSQEWYENGNLRSKGNYSQNLKTNLWHHYNYDGTIAEEGYYRNDKKIGLWKYYKNGSVESSYTYRDNKRHGRFAIYNIKGDITNQGEYKNDQKYTETNSIVEEKIIKTRPRIKTKNCEEQETEKEKSDCAADKMLRQIYEELKYPSSARDAGLQGRVISKLTISAEGELKDIRFENNLSNDIEAACRSAIETLTEWIPATINGKPIDDEYLLPIFFRIEN